MLVIAATLLTAYLSSFDITDSIELTKDGLYLVEGDMLYHRNPLLRFSLKGKQWPNATVYYTFENEDEYADEDLALIQESMKYIEDSSCVKFVKRTNQPFYVQIRAVQGCNAEVGYKEVERQQLVLDFPHCMTKGIIIHELMHILGFLHEQSRNDRDKYVDIHYDNIVKKKWPNFETSSDAVADHFGEPYDYKSVMHYQYNDYSIDKSKPSITSKNTDIKLTDFGEAKISGHLSEIDKRKLNKYYNCPKKN